MKHDWEYKPFAEVAEVFNGNSINADYKRNHFQGIKTGLPFIATKDVSFDGIIDYNNGVKIPNYYDYKVAPSGSVFVCAEGGSAGRKVAFITQNVCFGNKLYCISPKDNILNGRYLFLFVQAEVFREQFKTLMTGLIGGVSTKKFKTIVIPIPSMSEQEEIVARLDSAFEKIDTLRHNAEQSLTTAQQLFQSSLTNLLTPQPHWQRKTLKEVCIKYGDYGISAPSVPYNGERYVRITDIMDSGQLHKEMVSADPTRGQGERLIYGDLIFARTGATVGKTFMYTQEYGSCVYAGYLIRYRVNFQVIMPEYLLYFTHSDEYFDWIKKHQATAAQPNINAQKYNGLSLYVPPLPEQSTIVAKLDSLSAKVKQLKDNYTRTIALCDEMKQALLKEVFE